MTFGAEDLTGVQQLAARYWALADLTEDVPIAELFEPEALFELGSLRLEGREAIAAFLTERARDMRETSRTTRHLASSLLAIPESADRVRVRSTVVVFAANGALPIAVEAPSGIADFEDVCRRQPDGRWLYHSRSGRTVFVGPNAAAFAR